VEGREAATKANIDSEIRVERDGPYVVTNVKHFTGTRVHDQLNANSEVGTWTKTWPPGRCSLRCIQTTIKVF
jgi:hypothetical protein